MSRTNTFINEIDVAHYNAWALENDPDNMVWECLEDLADALGDDAATFARRVFFGDVQTWNGSHSFYKLNGYANIEEVRFTDELPPEYFESFNSDEDEDEDE